jgi:hypothetical protein
VSLVRRNDETKALQNYSFYALGWSQKSSSDEFILFGMLATIYDGREQNAATVSPCGLSPIVRRQVNSQGTCRPSNMCDSDHLISLEVDLNLYPPRVHIDGRSSRELCLSSSVQASLCGRSWRGGTTIRQGEILPAAFDLGCAMRRIRHPHRFPAYAGSSLIQTKHRDHSERS